MGMTSVSKFKPALLQIKFNDCPIYAISSIHIRYRLGIYSVQIRLNTPIYGKEPNLLKEIIKYIWKGTKMKKGKVIIRQRPLRRLPL